MAEPVTVTVTGADRVASTMKSAARDLGDLSEANKAAAAIFVAASRPPAPKLTGRLAAATRPAFTKTEAGFTNPEPYFGPIHYGWPAHNIRAQPFVDEGLDASEAQWLRVYEDAVDKAAAEVKGA